MDDVDWTLTRSFLAVAETGSLSAAARQLGLSQPTLGRHIADLELALGLPLFTRQPRGLAPTAEAAALIPHARAMREAAAKLALAVAGRDARLHGPVRISASRIVSQYLLPPMLAELRRDEPGIEIELVPTDASDNLLFREADIALRMYRPTQPDLITAHLCDIPMAMYAAHSYLARRPDPITAETVLNHEFVGFDRSDLMLRMMAAQGFHARREDFPTRCDDQIVYWSLIRAGLGLGGMQTIIGDADSAVTRVAPFLQLAPLPIWLTAPEALRHTPRIRRVFDLLSTHFRALKLDPAPPIG
ncbi:LysR family transcriptional regulator [Cypionkella sp.]|uniref:LysR family transcriptional regulator n=1 Tax=Cypionkella sp. TaxID=2811411 RepID=UPI00261B0A68|nr:LysR family transcriptional regulator [Cypionkella sp.]MDB5664492.1 LysR family transcriptional regulator [Cypionkella sp.]